MASSFGFLTRHRLSVGLLTGALAAFSACADGSDPNDGDISPIGTLGGAGATPGGAAGGAAGAGGSASGGSVSGAAGGSISAAAGGSVSGAAGGSASGTAGGGSASGAAGGATGGRPDGGVSADGGTAAGAGGTTGRDASAGSDGGGAAAGGGDAGVELSPLAAPLPTGTPKMGWNWVQTAGALCRDGSPAGYYWRRGTDPNLVIFMNGGGACSDPFFCGLNPVNVNQDLPTQSLIDATGNLLIGPDPNPQFPHEEGLFKRDPRNPVGNWNMIYVPYCTGDVFAGSRPDGTINGVDGKQQFVGYKNIGLFLDSFGPSFANSSKVLLTGSSAGGFGTLLNYDRVQEFFNKLAGKARVYGVTDSGIPFRDQYLPPCLQKRWREAWNLNAMMPAGCTGCSSQADGGGLAQGLGTFMFKEKYKDRVLGGMISSVEDGVIRAFFGAGGDNCNADPGLNTIASALNFGGYSGTDYRAGLKDVLDFVGRDKVHSFMIDSWEHMHLWRARFYEPLNGTTIAAWLGNILADKPPQHLGSL